MIHFGGGEITPTIIHYFLTSQVIQAPSAECERHFTALNARHIITEQRNMLFPEAVHAISMVLGGGGETRK